MPSLYDLQSIGKKLLLPMFALLVGQGVRHNYISHLFRLVQWSYCWIVNKSLYVWAICHLIADFRFARIIYRTLFATSLILCQKTHDIITYYSDTLITYLCLGEGACLWSREFNFWRMLLRWWLYPVFLFIVAFSLS